MNSVKKKTKDQIIKNSKAPKIGTSNKMQPNKNRQSDKESSFKNPYILELENCIENEWKDLCTFRKSLTKDEQERLSRAYNCLAAQFRKLCKRKVLEQICKESRTRSSKDKVNTCKKNAA